VSNKSNYKIYNFGSEDQEVQVWTNFETDEHTYDLSHLNACRVDYIGKKNTYAVYVTYSHHCFTKDQEGYNNDLPYPYPKDQRNFHNLRFQLSLNLPNIIDELLTAYTYHAGGESYAVCEGVSRDNNTYYYLVAFSVFKSQKKLRMHIKSAYQLDDRPKVKKVKFETILHNLSKGKPLPKRQA
jgi:hypothetical protein